MHLCTWVENPQLLTKPRTVGIAVNEIWNGDNCVDNNSEAIPEEWRVSWVQQSGVSKEQKWWLGRSERTACHWQDTWSNKDVMFGRYFVHQEFLQTMFEGGSWGRSHSPIWGCSHKANWSTLVKHIANWSNMYVVNLKSRGLLRPRPNF